MNRRSKLVLVMVCSVCFASVWMISSSRLTLGWAATPAPGATPAPRAGSPRRDCSCDTCVSERRGALMQRFQKSVHPFLTPNGTLTPEDFRWWRVTASRPPPVVMTAPTLHLLPQFIQLEKGDLAAFQRTKRRLFEMIPGRPDVARADPGRCRACAVVGNSGNLRGSRFGPQIDANDVVIRINLGQTTGFEADVGSRTTHRALYPESGMDLDNSTHLVLFPFKIMDLRWLIEAPAGHFYGRSYTAIKSKLVVNKDLVMVINPAFMKYVHQSWLSSAGRYPSTGFMTVVLALHICDKVNVFGFGADKNGNWNHYWEELRDKNLKTGIHPGTHEYSLIRELAEQNVLTFHRGW